MPKRYGHVWEELISDENCERAVLNAIKAKHKTRYLKHVKENYKEYGKRIKETIINGWEPDPIREKTINEGTDAKPRALRIPSLRDHIVHTAVAQILEKYLTKRFYFYTCGSLPKRGQTFASKAVQGYLRRKKPKYAALADIRKFYNSVKKNAVMRCLERVFKDRKFIELNKRILDQMGDGLAIGFTVSHWYAHLVMVNVDNEIKRKHTEVFLVRFMDNFVLMAKRKRSLHKAIRTIREKIAEYNLTLKADWQVFQVKKRMVQFLSYRLNHDKTILRKALMYKMARRTKRAKRSLNAHTARTIMSYFGILKHCDSYHFKQTYVYPNVSIKQCRRLISNADKKCLLCGAA